MKHQKFRQITTTLIKAIGLLGVCGSCLASCPVASVSMPTATAKQLAVHKLNSLLVCDSTEPLLDQSPCNIFASRGLELLFGIKDFKKSQNTHMSANEIEREVSIHPKWRRIGNVANEESSLCAQATANSGFPVIAAMSGTTHGHVVLIIPGEGAASPSWGNKYAPMSAGFFLNRPGDSYVAKPLSRAFNFSDAAKANYFYRTPENSF